jgi:hypothetical protein
MNLLAHKKIVIISMLFMLVLFAVVMLVVNPVIDGKNGLDVIAMQLAFSKEAGEKIIASWDVTAFYKWIVFDYLYAFAYGIFFASLISWLEKKKGVAYSLFSYIAVAAALFDWTENSLELWFLHDPAGFSSVLFFVHSCLAALKWLALPVVLGRIVHLYRHR